MTWRWGEGDLEKGHRDRVDGGRGNENADDEQELGNTRRAGRMKGKKRNKVMKGTEKQKNNRTFWIRICS